ncbi:alkaline phosphatase D family protein [Roseococcus sp. SDR]|uniref:alkaline phosphatase D family protein n=1 Tax=Roseococcus sp. SDR TaxID=2835532 RepID=UPI001BCFD3EA|nr:alkaline phosphatase D family protein [Roseococcus sp. SDR]MBS7790119.1 alkaline phosphatase D family protein [Roseococcus sp. SDR]MBV1845433.1 alkaline phosphatase D family protein [Roseococcus sp. SDR]
MDSATRHMLTLARRGLLRGATGLAALAVAQPPRARAQAPGNPFTLGLASGDPWPDSVVLWTRLAPAPLEPGGGMAPVPVTLRWELGADEQMRRILRSGEVVARPEDAHSVHLVLEGLEPARSYFYRFRFGQFETPIGRTRTAPAPGADAEIRFLNAGCQNYEHGHFTAWRHAAAEDSLDFVFHYGDYIYEYAGRQPGARGWGPIVRTHHGGETLTLDDYRSRYAQYRSDADLAAAHAAHPFIVSYDDHEVENNWVGLISQRDGGARFPVATPHEVFALRAAAAFQAWYEHMPVRPAAKPRGTEITAYRRLRFGRRLDLHVLDTRRFRDDQPCGDGVVTPCDAVNRPDAQVLGAAQEAWLRDGVANSPATWQVLAQQIFLAPRLFPRGTRSMDSWDGYPAARQRLLDIFANRQGGIALTGDVHRAWANDVGPLVEFVGTSITSEGDGSDIQATAPEIMAANPHLKFNSNRRGYTLHIAGRDQMHALYRAVPFVQQPGAPLTTVGQFIAPLRGGGVERA